MDTILCLATFLKYFFRFLKGELGQSTWERHLDSLFSQRSLELHSSAHSISRTTAAEGCVARVGACHAVLMLLEDFVVMLHILLLVINSVDDVILIMDVVFPVREFLFRTFIPRGP